MTRYVHIKNIDGGIKMKQFIYGSTVILCLILLLSACQKEPKTPEVLDQEEVPEAMETSNELEEEFVVALKDKEGIIRATAILTEDKEGVHMDVKADHLQPGHYGFHIHEKGICEAPDFKTAGGHFNPDEKAHGLKHENGAHAGDLENIIVREDGSIDQSFITDKVTLQKHQKHSIHRKEGTSLIMHEEKDDGVSQPAGDAGARMLCGVITKPSKTSMNE